jgi:hypothetical protein
MKIRSGFVSNSSSSSFIIAYKKLCACLTCGLTPPNIVSIIEAGNQDTMDNRVRWTDPTSKLKEIEDEIVQYQCDLKKYHRCGVDEKDEANIQWIESSIERLQKLSQLIQEHKEDVVAEIEIDYHDDYLNKIFQEMVINKHVCVLEGEDDFE